MSTLTPQNFIRKNFKIHDKLFLILKINVKTEDNFREKLGIQNIFLTNIELHNNFLKKN